LLILAKPNARLSEFVPAEKKNRNHRIGSVYLKLCVKGSERRGRLFCEVMSEKNEAGVRKMKMKGKKKYIKVAESWRVLCS